MGIASKLAQPASGAHPQGDTSQLPTKPQAQQLYPTIGIHPGDATPATFDQQQPQHNAAPYGIPVQQTVIGYAHGYPLPQQPQHHHANSVAGPPQLLPGTSDVQSINFKLKRLVQENQLHTFFSPQAVADLAGRVSQKNLRGLAHNWRLQPKMILDLAALSLYDTVVLCDDSASMRLAEGGDRIRDLKAVLERVATICGLLDTDGITLLALNQDLRQDNVRTAAEAAHFVDQMRFEGMTPLGTVLQRKVLEPFVLHPSRTGTLSKPVHVIVITDGEPTGEPPKEVKNVISRVVSHFKSSRWGPGAVSFQFAQVGTDQQAQAFLAKLDTDKKFGNNVDCTSAYEIEQEEYLKQTGVDLTPDMYLNKLCLGAIDRSYDAQDESKKRGFLTRLFA